MNGADGTPEKPDTGVSRIRTVRELLLAYPNLRPPILDGLLREGETMNVIAGSKVGKSWLTIDLALSIATGRPWLGRFPAERGKVLIIDNELHPETSSHRLPQVAEARGISRDEYIDSISVDNRRGSLKSLDELGPYFREIGAGKYKLIILDAFYRFLSEGTDENDNGAMARLYNRLDSYADILRSGFALVHHASKGGQSGKAVTDVGAGAGAQSRATDTHLVMRPHEEDGVVVLDAAVRSWRPINPICLRWDFPVWNEEHGLDPRLLRPDGPTRRKREKAEDKVKVPQPWNAKRFVETFIVGDSPLTQDEIFAAVSSLDNGPSQRQAKQWLHAAQSQRLVVSVRLPGRGGRVGWKRPSEDDRMLDGGMP